MTFESWERANKAYRLVYGTLPAMAHYDYDNPEFCEFCVKEYFRILFEFPNTNPLTKKFCTLKSLLNWFDSVFPLGTD